MKSFHDWKQAQVVKDTADNGGTQTFRSKDWYYYEYGQYCERIRIARQCKCGDCICCRTAQGEIS